MKLYPITIIMLILFLSACNQYTGPNPEELVGTYIAQTEVATVEPTQTLTSSPTMRPTATQTEKPTSLPKGETIFEQVAFDINRR